MVACTRVWVTTRYWGTHAAAKMGLDSGLVVYERVFDTSTSGIEIVIRGFLHQISDERSVFPESHQDEIAVGVERLW